MLQHACLCGDEVLHPESPGRVERILDKLQEAGLVPRYTLGEDLKKKNVLHVRLFYGGANCRQIETSESSKSIAILLYNVAWKDEN